MEFRRLSREEHGRTRRLYQEAYPEDGPRFTDYYYQWKTRDNVIFAALDGERVCGMVHLNPFVFQIRGQRRSLHYLVAVPLPGIPAAGNHAPASRPVGGVSERA